ncbi:hypothetical protein [Desulfobacter postgatei]|mgnify:CR=1 FL=1|uniref:hypothetical protein n=1 Tax=Desulfobacter postgatei TaxID=2293 RepID=UPI00259B116D|nr:hypothetical protein [uncultured Desulfobacter sp.]
MKVLTAYKRAIPKPSGPVEAGPLERGRAMKKVTLAIMAVIGLCLAGVESNNFAAQCWLNIAGACGFVVGIVRLAELLKNAESVNRG